MSSTSAQAHRAPSSAKVWPFSSMPKPDPVSGVFHHSSTVPTTTSSSVGWP